MGIENTHKLRVLTGRNRWHTGRPGVWPTCSAPWARPTARWRPPTRRSWVSWGVPGLPHVIPRVQSRALFFVPGCPHVIRILSRALIFVPGLTHVIRILSRAFVFLPGLPHVILILSRALLVKCSTLVVTTKYVESLRHPLCY